MSTDAPAVVAKHRRRTREETRRAIVDAGTRLFSRQGYTRTSMRDIAAEVRVTEPALYRHFASKRELLDAVLHERMSINWPEWVDETRRSVPLAIGLERMAVGALAFIERNRDFFRLVLFEALAGDTGALEHHQGVMARWRAGIRGLIVDPEHPAPAETAALVEDFVTALWGIGLQRLLGVDDEPLADAQGEPTTRCRTLAHRLVARLLVPTGQADAGA